MKSVLFLLSSVVAITCTLANVGTASSVECRVSESLTNTTFKVNLTEEEREQVLIEGRCFLGCALERYGEQFETVSYSLSEYWPYINDTGVECSTSSQVHECTRGCIRALRYFEFHVDCIRICSGGCNMECEPFTAQCHPWIHMGCPITCVLNYQFSGNHPCRLGCRLEEHLYYEARDGNLPLDPIGPPRLIPSQNSTKAGHFFIDLRSAAPKPKEGDIVNRTLISPVTFLLRFEQVYSTDVFFNWTVNPFVEIDLSSYACQDLLVSFAVSNQAGLSNFSVPTQITIHGGPPAAPSEVMTTADQSQFTPSTASITLTWSASSGADNYTVMVTPLLPSGQSLVSTTTTSLQLTVLYNEEYSINITAKNFVGSNSTILPLTIVGCSPPSPLANGSISEYRSGAVGAMLTFQCDTGYMPQEEAVTSTCLSNSSWVPTPECELLDCGVPFHASGVIIHPFNNTKFGALITFLCEENDNSMTAVCGNDGEWVPNPASVVCGEFGNTFPGTAKATDSSSGNTVFTTSQLIITVIVCYLVCLVLGVFAH